MLKQFASFSTSAIITGLRRMTRKIDLFFMARSYFDLSNYFLSRGPLLKYVCVVTNVVSTGRNKMMEYYKRRWSNENQSITVGL